MPKGVSAKGYKMTENRRHILTTLVEEGGEVKSNEGKSTGMLHGLLGKGGSTVALNMTLRELENLGWVERLVEGKRTYNISITDEGRQVLADESPQSAVKETRVAAAVIEDPSVTAELSDEEWEEPDPSASLHEGIDYDILLGVFLKAALRGMEGPSSTEVDYLKQQNDLAANRIQELEATVDQLRAEAASAIAERDQLQKNLNVIMSKAEKKGVRGTDPVRSLLSPAERKMLDNLMRQVPTRQGN